MLSTTEDDLDHISDADMYLCFEKDIISWFTYISKRYRKAKNKYLTSFDPKKPMKYITYLEKNDLHRCAILNSLPTSGFKWLDHTIFNLAQYDNNSSTGFILETDLEYPRELSKMHNCYPLAP